MPRGKPGSGNPDKKDPVYTVVKVEGPKLTVIQADVSAKKQEDACDKVVGSLPLEEQNGPFAAFLAGSYREFEYETETKPIRNKKPRERSFGRDPAAQPPAKPTPVTEPTHSD